MKVTRIPSASDSCINGIIYGITGVGKTHFIGSMYECEETNPCLIINLDKGLTTLTRHPLRKQFRQVQPHNFDELQEIYDELRQGGTKYRSVAIDTLTEYQQGISMGNLLEEVDAEMEFDDLSSAKVPDRQHWLKSHAHVRKILRGFRDLSYHEDPASRLHVIFTAAERADEKRNMVGPALPGVMLSQAGGYVDMLARLTVVENKNGEEVRHLQLNRSVTDDGFEVLAKNRMGLGKGILDPTMDKLIARWHKAIADANAA